MDHLGFVFNLIPPSEVLEPSRKEAVFDEEFGSIGIEVGIVFLPRRFLFRKLLHKLKRTLVG